MNSINWQNNHQEHPFCTFFNSAHSDADKEGPAVYTARALLRGIDSLRVGYMHECEKVYPTSISNRESIQQAENNMIKPIDQEVSIIPNPAKNDINVIHKGIYSSMNIEETSGKVVLSIGLNQTVNSEQIDVSSLSNGLYLVKLANKNNSSVLKLIINK